MTRRELFIVSGLASLTLYSCEREAASMKKVEKSPSDRNVGEKTLFIDVVLGALRRFDDRLARANKIMADADPCIDRGPGKTIPSEITGLRRLGMATTIAFGHTVDCLRGAASR